MGGGIDHLEADTFSPLGAMPIVVMSAGADLARYRATTALIVGVDREGTLPTVSATDFDVLFTTASAAPAPWVTTPPRALDDRIAALESAVRHAPLAAGALRQVLRIGERLAFADALVVESFAYSSLLGGREFRAWRHAQSPSPQRSPEGSPPVRIERKGNVLTLALARPASRNAITASMRDALCEALAAALDDPTRPNVRLAGDGACFSVGGALEEFGGNDDLAQTHAIRIQRSVASLIHELGDRIEVVFHGACIGAGVEGPAAAGKRLAHDGAFFQLPELKMGLIPGAGGTATLTRAIGRHRACAMMMTGARVTAATALEWGLIHELAPR